MTRVGLKEKLKSGTVYGTFTKTNDPLIIEAIARAGCDFVILDMEHGPNSFREVLPLVYACREGGASPVIRVKELNKSEIQRALDLGIDAVQIPDVKTVEEARKAVAYSNFSPLGERGLCGYVRPAHFGMKDRPAYTQEQNFNNSVIVHIEGKEAIQNLDELLGTAGIDVFFIGPNDISNSLGVPGQVNHPKVEEAIKEIVRKASEREKYTGIFVDNLANGRKYKDMGIKYLAYSTDVGVMTRSFNGIFEGLKGEGNGK